MVGRGDSPSIWPRWLLLAGVVLSLAWAYGVLPAFQAFVHRVISPMAMGEIGPLKELVLSFGWWAPVFSALLMILQTVIAPLPAFVLAMANAMAFGVFYGCLLTCASALLAAFTAFYLARWLGRPLVKRWVSGRSFDASLEKYGAWGVLAFRLFPVVSFDFVSYAAGLTAMRARYFGLATLIGMLPATIAYSLIGDTSESSNILSVAGGAVLLVLLIVGAWFLREGVAPDRTDGRLRSKVFRWEGLFEKKKEIP